MLPVPTSAPLVLIGQVANDYASQNVFTAYQNRIAENTLSRQADDLALFARYLNSAGVMIEPTALVNDPNVWGGVTFGLLDGFVRWMLAEGYAIGSVNVRLSTVKVYCKLATKAGVLSANEYAMIKLVTGYRHAEGKHVDQKREVTRKGTKKAVAVSLSKEQATTLKRQPETPQGHRDAFLMCLLLDHGLRCGEAAALTIASINLDGGTLTFYREKVDKTQTHYLTRDTLVAAKRYLAVCEPPDKLLMGSRKGGKLQGMMSTRAITDRVKVLGEAIGLEGLSAHDCRHYWATSAVKGGRTSRTCKMLGAGHRLQCR